ncbi:MAG: hypothetical protein DHS20C13_03680 [Thermodesulfobacteriota bacterium]|nr:MAG: hypothetical protein DHS20C13_03680 [Thermodesulfobacteriota bacterium]
MTKANIEELEFETTSCFMAYDAKSGEVLYIHECMKQKGPYEPEADPNEDTVLQMVREDYGNRNLKVMKLPEDFELKSESTYHVDPSSGELEESYSPTVKFRDFIKQAE